MARSASEPWAQIVGTALARRQNLLWVSEALRLEAVGDPRPAIVRDERQPIDRAVSRQHLGVEAETAIQVRGGPIPLPAGAHATRLDSGRLPVLHQIRIRPHVT